MMCHYRCDAATGQWKHHSGQTESRELSRFDPLTTGDFSMKKNSGEEEESVAMVLDRAFANADLILEEARKDKRSMRKAYKARRSSSGLSQGDGLVEELRWYVRPEECGEWLRDGVMTPPNTESDEILGALNPQQ
uniref:Uncharacterized protein n=1 Tax=Cyclophora tenuis TaxID=216820 RepID=A0A7S1D128_CYCTE